MSPRRSAADAAQTRAAIVDRAVAISSAEGLGSLSFGHVAAGLPLTKSGVVRHFPTKEDLQLAALAEARRQFLAEVWGPGAGRPAGLERLRAVMAAWLRYLARCPLPGGCVLTAASSEFDGRPGPVRDAVLADEARLTGALEREIDIAVRSGELPAGTDAAQLAFELRGIALAVNQAVQLRGDAKAATRGRRAVRRLLG